MLTLPSQVHTALDRLTAAAPFFSYLVRNPSI